MRLQDVTIRFRRPSTVAEIALPDIQLGDGNIVAAVGPSGSGKTTFLKALCGMLPPMQPRRWWTGLHPLRLNDDIAYSGSIAGTKDVPLLKATAYLPQDPAFFDGLSVYDNVLLGEDVTVDEAVLRGRLAELAGRLALDHPLDSDVRVLSGGERQRVAIARCLLHRSATVFCLDEPFAGLDGASKRRAIETIHSLARNLGRSFVIVTHELEDLFPFITDVLIFEPGPDRRTRVRRVAADEIRNETAPDAVMDAVAGTGESITLTRIGTAARGTLRLPVRQLVLAETRGEGGIAAEAMGPRLEHRQLATLFVPAQRIRLGADDWEVEPRSITLFCPRQLPRGSSVFLDPKPDWP